VPDLVIPRRVRLVSPPALWFSISRDFRLTGPDGGPVHAGVLATYLARVTALLAGVDLPDVSDPFTASTADTGVLTVGLTVAAADSDAADRRFRGVVASAARTVDREVYGQSGVGGIGLAAVVARTASVPPASVAVTSR